MRKWIALLPPSKLLRAAPRVRIAALADGGADITDCVIIEIFCGTARVTASLKKLGMVNSFGTDHVKHKHAAAQVVTAHLLTREGEQLLFQWLSDPHVVGIHLAPPCKSASRARAIRLKRRNPGSEPRALRSDHAPNGLHGLGFIDKLKISKANKLYHLTAKLVKWACEEGLVSCIENPQFAHFWNTTFMHDVWHLLDFAVFHTCQYGGSLKRCPGTSSKRRRTSKSFQVASIDSNARIARCPHRSGFIASSS